jgi:hypothetical protein
MHGNGTRSGVEQAISRFESTRLAGAFAKRG